MGCDFARLSCKDLIEATERGQVTYPFCSDLMDGSFFKRAPLLIGSNMAEGQEMLLQLVPDIEEREVLQLTAGELDQALARLFPSHPESVQSLVG